MNVRLLFAGILTLIAGVISTAPNTWVVALVGGCMIGVALYRDQIALAALRARQDAPVAQPATAERITRERWRETRERRR
ncbi:hypothetical protein I5G59_gp39 [Mycobacterium phage LilMcDreamy]|uniref:Uncharacterized protein n=1 Tax=Mycobacterium phage LilMcDreamy TaxID=2652422 RepID=A0A5P8D8I9_9CAUD|nr:hypothetical protein I5G59_gp39 [Mycobacterium phage LilMcDreamy]QFP94659.1 hypothetical protein SEA_LILMCDREAMY_39 [Mycobacterium phage LilMcDreamy]